MLWSKLTIVNLKMNTMSLLPLLPSQIQVHDVQDAGYDHVHPGWKPDVENEDDVADEVVEDEVVDVQFDVVDEVCERLADVHDVDRGDFLQEVGSQQSGMYLTLMATHTGVGHVDQSNEV